MGGDALVGVGHEQLLHQTLGYIIKESIILMIMEQTEIITTVGHYKPFLVIKLILPCNEMLLHNTCMNQ